MAGGVLPDILFDIANGIWIGLLNILHPIWTIVSNVPFVLTTDPHFQTGLAWLDIILAIGLFIMTFLVFADIIFYFIEAIEAAQADKLQGYCKIRWKAFRYLIVAAISTTVVVNLLRYEFRHLKLEFFVELSLPGDRLNMSTHLRGFLSRLAGPVVFPYFYDEYPHQLAEKYPWLPADSSHMASVWGYFSFLFASGRSLWWSRQWFMGLLAWVVFVAIECE